MQDNAESKTESLMESDPAPPETRPRILFVDDDRDLLESLQRMLNDYADRWDMTFTDCPGEAVTLFSSEKIDVTVLDLQMPGITGFDLLSELEKFDPADRPKAIVLTGMQDRDLKRQALNRGASDLLNKPVIKEDLLARISSALRERAYEREINLRNRILEQQLLESQRVELVGLLAAGAVHDLKNLLGGILGYSDLLLSKLDKGLGQMRTAGDHATRIIEQIHRLSRSPDAGSAQCDICKVVDDCLDLVSATSSKQISVIWNHPGCKFVVEGDETQVYQLLMNLCINAVQAMGDSGDLRISISAVRPEDIEVPLPEGVKAESFAQLRISDTGEGMDVETLSRIFEPSFTTRGQHGGSGLGMTVVRQIIRNCLGVIETHSTPGKGTTIGVYLPLASPSSQAEKELEPGSKGASKVAA